jgi:hypothetical protein
LLIIHCPVPVPVAETRRPLADFTRIGVIAASRQHGREVGRRMVAPSVDGSPVDPLRLGEFPGFLQEKAQPEGAHRAAPLVCPSQAGASLPDGTAFEEQDAEIGCTLRAAGGVGARIRLLRAP